MDKDQLAVLKAFYEVSYDYYVHGYDFIKDETGLDRKPAYKAVHALMKIGYLEYVKGCMTDDGEVAGSGFMMVANRRDHIIDILESEGLFNDY